MLTVTVEIAIGLTAIITAAGVISIAVMCRPIRRHAVITGLNDID